MAINVDNKKASDNDSLIEARPQLQHISVNPYQEDSILLLLIHLGKGIQGYLFVQFETIVLKTIKTVRITLKEQRKYANINISKLAG